MQKINIFVLTLTTAFAMPAAVSAQTYPETDVEGNKVYYKIVSASEEYAGKCLEDNSAAGATSKYKFLVNNIAEDNANQEWELIADASADNKYYLRNRRSRRYIATDGEWVNNYRSVANAATKVMTDAFEFEPLADKQIAIKFNDGTADQYVYVADSAQSLPVFEEYNLDGSRWAWYVAGADGKPVSINTITADKSVEVSVVNRRIKVSDGKDYELFDAEGRQLPAGGTLMPGVYIVVVNNTAHKVSVK